MHELHDWTASVSAAPPEKHRAALRRPDVKLDDGRAGVVADRPSKGAKF
jgi:hypothetical protein